MKKIILLFLLLCAGYSYSQTIGDELSYFKSQHPDGEVNVNNYGVTVFTTENVPIYTYYYFDSNNLCDCIIISATTTEARNAIVNLFNDTWIVINPSLWRYYRGNGSILNCEVMYEKEMGVYFKIYSIK
jgi:hypothetical protein